MRGFHGEQLQGPGGPGRPRPPCMSKETLNSSYGAAQPGCLEERLTRLPWGTVTFRASELEGPPRAPPQPPSGKVPGEATGSSSGHTGWTSQCPGRAARGGPERRQFLFQGDRRTRSQDCAQGDARPRERCHPPPCGREGERSPSGWQVRGLQPGLSGGQGARVLLTWALPPPVPTTAKRRTPAPCPAPS